MKTWTLYIMALLYIAAGVNHFFKPQMYVQIVPPWLPAPLAIVYISGVCEIILGALLFPESTRSMAAWGIIALLIAVFPANIQMVLNYYQRHHTGLWATIVRLPIQVLLIWWAWLYTRK